MKIIALGGSRRINGNTQQLLELVERRLKEKAAAEKIPLDFEMIALSQLNLALCRGCRACFDKGEDRCPLKDDLQLINKKLLEADGVILASPVYVEDVSATMKNFIDRMAFHCHRPAFFGKASLVLSSSGSGASGHTARTMQTALGVWGFHPAGKGNFRMGALMDSEQVRQKCEIRAVKLADALFESIRKGKPGNPSFYSLLVFKIQQKYWEKDEYRENELDYAYWRNRGWLDPKCEYYIKHRASFVKCASARLLGSAMARFFV